MSIRGDFYAGRGPDAQWLGSLACGAHPEDLFGPHGIDLDPYPTLTEARWRDLVSSHLAIRVDATRPQLAGWPWAWDDPATTDYAYAHDGGEVYGSHFGGPWFDVRAGRSGRSARADRAAFPDMSHRRRLAHGTRSGFVVLPPRRTGVWDGV